MIKTMHLKIFSDSEVSDHIVSHVFIEDDGLRCTDYYICGTQQSAERLIRCIRKPDEPDREA